MTTETFQQPLLQVAQLSVSFPSSQGVIEAVNALSFDVHAGEVLALVGESGSGKSVTARTLVGLAGAGAAVRAESLILQGHDGLSQNLLACDARRWQQLRGREIGFVLQDALTSLDPLRRIGQEVAEPLLTHRLERGAAVRERVAELLTQTGIPDPHNRMAQYAHELSGGLRQRALIASALAAGPRLLIADEPTTALDATVQKQVLNVFRALADAGHGVLLITHDLSVVADIADRVAVFEQPQVHNRVTFVQLPYHKANQADRRDNRHHDNGRRREPVFVVALIQHHLQQAHAKHQQRDANIVDRR